MLLKETNRSYIYTACVKQLRQKEDLIFLIYDVDLYIQKSVKLHSFSNFDKQITIYEYIYIYAPIDNLELPCYHWQLYFAFTEAFTRFMLNNGITTYALTEIFAVHLS